MNMHDSTGWIGFAGVSVGRYARLSDEDGRAVQPPSEPPVIKLPDCPGCGDCDAGVDVAGKSICKGTGSVA